MASSFRVRKGAWTSEEDLLLRQCIEKYGEGNWHHVPLRSGLKRCRKSCRLRWLNYLRPDIKRGQFTSDEVDLIIKLHKLLGNRWTLIAGRLSGRTANDIKNYWNTHMQKKKLSVREEVKANTQKMVENNVIRPQPRTFSKNSPWLRRETKDVDTNQSRDMLVMSSPKFPLVDNTLCCENRLAEKEEKKEISCSITGSREELFTSFWVEDMEPMTKEGNIFVEEGNNAWDDLCFDVDLWGLLGHKKTFST